MKNTEIDIRIRMLFLLEYAAVTVCTLGTAIMTFFTDSIVVLIPNFALIIFTLLGLFFSHIKKNYDLAADMIIIGCAYIALPVMYFTSGGYRSGMPIWFVFSVIFTCMMAAGRARIIMSSITIIIDMLCIYVGYAHSDWIIPLKDADVAFWDMFQSYLIVSIVTVICLVVYLSTYDKQRQMLEYKSRELSKVMMVDSLTGVPNRRAYFDMSAKFRGSRHVENLVLIVMDVNGLKKVNDTLGHSAGDAMIKTAAGIMERAFTGYGSIFRTGGDEFVALLSCDDETALSLSEVLDKQIAVSESEWAVNLTIACGVVLWNQHRLESYEDIEKMADSLMYKNKSEFYKKNGIDRRKR